MLSKLPKYLVAFLVLLHCLGVTQLVSAYSKDKSAFTNMLSMTEEETKKEKESKDCEDEYESQKHKELYLLPLSFATHQWVFSHNAITGFRLQYLAENPTPPPDQLA